MMFVLVRDPLTLQPFWFCTACNTIMSEPLDMKAGKKRVFV